MSGDPQQLLDAKRTLNHVVQIFGAFGTELIPESSRQQFAVDRYHPERFLEVVRGGIGELLEVSIRCGESIIGGAQGVGVTLARRHIPRNLRSSNDSALLIQPRGNGQRDRQNPSVFCFSPGFVVVDALARLETIENFGRFVGAAGRGKDRDVVADCFIRSVAKNPFRAAIPADDYSTQVSGNDRVI
ncbi:MAG TPA: hypothetical protein VGM43_05360 [Bryobacteraceae bacterium]|jgi:hypothetical protein